MTQPNFDLPPGFIPRGDSIHGDEPRPHLTGAYWVGGPTVHLPYVGQTTLGMFDTSCGAAHRLGDVRQLAERFPSIFRDSGLKY
jgi:hypothetical protein